MYGLRYPSQKKQGFKGPDKWTYFGTNGKVDTNRVCQICGYSSNTYIGWNDVNNANARSLLRLFNPNSIPRRFADIFISNSDMNISD